MNIRTGEKRSFFYKLMNRRVLMVNTYEDVFRKYNIDETRMFRYAKRRNFYESLLSFINEKPEIQLMTI